MKRFLVCLLSIPMLAFAGSALAQHGGDVEFDYGNSSIVIHSGEIGYADGTRVFEAEFGPPGSGLFERFTDEPGFISETDINLGIGANDIIDYQIRLGRFGYFLNYWNPVTSLVEATASTITIGDNPAGTWVVGNNFGGGTGPGQIGQADGLGDFHWHIDFTLSPGSSTGIYAMLMELETDASGIANSDPFWVVWNYGASEADHERGVAFFAAVPEPASGMVLVGIGLLTVMRRKRIC